MGANEVGMRAIFLLMGRYNCKPLLTFAEACDEIGKALQTGYNEVSQGTFPLPVQRTGSKMYVDIRDVAEYLDSKRAKATAI
jgi:hypothetical protein